MGGQTMELLKESSVTANVVGMSATEYEAFIDERWGALERLRDWSKNEVRDGTLKPIEGVKVLACATGTIFGYEEFHPRGVPGTPESLVSTLLGQPAAFAERERGI
jgi:hypothetical protein